MEKLIARINALYHKKNTVGLTKEEEKENEEIRREYINMVKGNVRQQLNKVEYVGDKKKK